MKQWKKVVAIALAAVMSLAVLTGCSGSTGSGSYPRDAAKEEQLTNSIKSYIDTNYSAYSSNLKSTKRVADASAAGFSAGIKLLDLQQSASSDEVLTDASKALSNAVADSLQKKFNSGTEFYMASVPLRFRKEVGIKDDAVKTYLDQYAKEIMEKFQSEGVAPSEYGVAVTVHGQYIDAILTIVAIKVPDAES